MTMDTMVHGGPDAQGVPAHDFSTNANACGPCPLVVERMRDADAQHYPDPHYTQLRAALAAFHGVEPQRIVIAASASEFIHRISAFAARQGMQSARLPAHSYGDYARAAQLQGLAVSCGPSSEAVLHWACDPSSPLGAHDDALAHWESTPASADLRVIDCAYMPLRLHESVVVLPASAWQMWTPNKALGLTGVRAAYAVAPVTASAGQIELLNAMTHSWPVGAHGVALLQAWAQADVQHWLASILSTLNAWKAQQIALCQTLGMQVVQGSQANYFTAKLPGQVDAGHWLAGLRSRGVKLRDCASFGLPGHVRMGVLPPASQAALLQAWRDMETERQPS